MAWHTSRWMRRSQMARSCAGGVAFESIPSPGEAYNRLPATACRAGLIIKGRVRHGNGSRPARAALWQTS